MTTVQDRAIETTATAESIIARMDRLPQSRTVWLLIVLLSLGFFFELFSLLFAGYVAPGLVKSGILTPTTPGLFGTTGVASFIAALFSGLFLGTIACGFLADRFGRRAIFTYSLLWYAAAKILIACQTTAFGLNFWQFVSGLGIGVEMVTIGAYVSELAPKHMRGRAFALCQTFGFSATPVVAYLSYLLIPAQPFGIDGWRVVVALGASGALVVWWLRLGLPESPRWLIQKGRVAEADRIVTALEARVRAETGQELPPPQVLPHVADYSRFADIWVPPYRKRAIMMTAFNVFQTVGYFGFASWVPTLLIKQGITVTSSLLYTTIIALAAPVGPMIGLLIADRFERKHVIVALALVNIVAGLSFSQASGPLAIIACGVCLTLAGNIISYSYHSYQQELFPTGIRARAVGFVYSWSRFSAIFTAFIVAFVLQYGGVTGVFVVIGAAMLIVALVIGLMGPRTRNLALENISH
jgi:MFS transporter, putative metabolite:H+ symporter